MTVGMGLERIVRAGVARAHQSYLEKAVAEPVGSTTVGFERTAPGSTVGLGIDHKDRSHEKPLIACTGPGTLVTRMDCMNSRAEWAGLKGLRNRLAELAPVRLVVVAEEQARKRLKRQTG